MFIAAVFTTDKRWKQSKCPSGMGRDDVVQPYNGIFFSRERNEADTRTAMDEL